MSARNRGLPVWMTGETYARATLCGLDVGKSVDQWVEWVTLQAIVIHERQQQTGKPTMPFVRSAPEATASNLAGRPSSRHHQKAEARKPGSTAAKPGPERPAATRSAASMARTREDPPVDAGEDHGIPPGDDRWGPPVGEVEQPQQRSGPRPRMPR